MSRWDTVSDEIHGPKPEPKIETRSKAKKTTFAIPGVYVDIDPTVNYPSTAARRAGGIELNEYKETTPGRSRPSATTLRAYEAIRELVVIAQENEALGNYSEADRIREEIAYLMDFYQLTTQEVSAWLRSHGVNLV